MIAAAEGELQLSQRQHQERQTTTQAEVREAEAAVKLAQEEVVRYQALANTGAVSQSQIGEKKANLEVALARLQRSQAALNPSSASIDIAREKIAQEQSRKIATLATLKKEQKALTQQKTRLQNEVSRDRQELNQVNTNLNQTIIRAPITGIIQQLNLRNPDQLVQQGSLIAQVAPHQVPLVIKASVASQEIGQVKIGQPVTMKVSSCPYSDYGTLNGQITTIAPDRTTRPTATVDSTIQDSSEPSANGYYEVTIQTPTQSLKSHHQTCHLQSGMDGMVDIVTRQETVLVFLLRKARLLMDI